MASTETYTKKPNLWLKTISDYWSNPANVIGPPGALVRRGFKFIWLALSIYILVWVAAPLQIASWQLWMTDDNLAARVGWSFTIASALGFAIVRYAAEATEPMRVPLLLPIVEFEEKKYKGWQIKPAHLHLPTPTVLIGGVMVAALFAISLLGLWNLYLHEQQTTGGASVAAISSSTDRVAEAERALAEFEQRTTAQQTAITAAIAATPAGSPTGRSRLVRQQAEAARMAAAERRELQAELRNARAATVTTHQNFADPRPVDGQVAGGLGWERPVTASVLDLFRSAVVEMLLIMGGALGLIGATSRVGVGSGVSREKLESETVLPTTAQPEEEPPPQQRARPRFTLPAATPQDFATAAVIGPLAGTAAPETPEPETPASDDPGAIDGEAGEEIDPLTAAHLNPENEENVERV